MLRTSSSSTTPRWVLLPLPILPHKYLLDTITKMDRTKRPSEHQTPGGRASSRAQTSWGNAASQGSRGHLLSRLANFQTGAERALLPLAAVMLLLLSCTPKETKALLGPSEALGTVRAKEAARIAGARKQVAIISPDANWGAASAAEEAFKNALKKQGFTILTAKAANLGDPMRRAQLGLKAGDFLDALDKSAEAGAIVSFAGAPMLSPGDAARVQPGHPPVLVVATASLGNVPGIWG